MATPEFDHALEHFRTLAAQAVQAHFARNDFTFAIPSVEIAKGGRKYVKLIRVESNPETLEKQGQTFVHSFVEIATGDIFKPASHKAPAKHARGNIFSDDPASCLTAHGDIFYLR
jgi:hypothetical protein